MTYRDLYQLCVSYTKLNALGMVAQFSYHTDDFTSELCIKHDNLAELRSWAGHHGSVFSCVPKGEKLPALFCHYINIPHFLSEYDYTIRTNYSNAAQNSNNFILYLAGLCHGKWGAWSSDPDYFSNLLLHADKVGSVVFGNNWGSKRSSAVDYAVQSKKLTETEQQIVKLLYATKSQKGEGGKMPGYQNINNRIWIDAGHGGSDPGAIGADGTTEASLNLEISNLLAEQLLDLGYDVYTTRKKDTTIELSRRAQEANAVDADVFISIHANAASNKDAAGLEVYTFTKGTEAEKLAEIVAKNLRKVLPPINANAKKRSTVKQKNLAVLRETKMPAILIETGFITNAQELEVLKSSAPKIAGAIADSVEGWFHAGS